ncbi:HNH endonuclease [Kitasatospora sp. NPDC088556]|uniref:HNH endonuclease n=1 Tax=Kitasatospora sp. NPDC088556 TaxID=3364076 RepID=UPI00382F4AE7
MAAPPKDSPHRYCRPDPMSTNHRYLRGALCAVLTAPSPRLTGDAARHATRPTKLALVARRHSGAERLRRLVDRAGSARCGLCGGDFPAVLVDVDHQQPLALEGEDTDDTVWPLCRECHRGKTARDFGP